MDASNSSSKAGFLREEEFDQLYQQMLIDTLDNDFTCVTFGLTVCGEKVE